MCTKNHNHTSYGCWATESVRQKFLTFWAIFCPVTLLTTHKINILEKWKCHHFTLVYQKSWSYDMIYASWDMACDRHTFLSFWVIYCSFTPLMTLKTKIWKQCKKYPGILFFYIRVPLVKILWCMVSEIWSTKNRFFVIFWTLTLLTNPKNPNFEKRKNMPGYLIILDMCTIN